MEEPEVESCSVTWERLLTEADFDLATAIQDGNESQYRKAREIKEWLLHMQKVLEKEP